MASQIPTPESMTHSQYTTLLSQYQHIVETVYKNNKRLKDSKKLSDALKDDVWRYEELPKLVKSRERSTAPGLKGGTHEIKGWKGGHLEKQELERLVQWKITHGQYRPTLPKLISSNEATLIKSRTWGALRNPRPTETMSDNQSKQASAFNELVKNLKGVGPATATLILSIGHPDEVPFFSDELYAWLTQTNLKNKDNKLRYNQSEYGQIVEAWNKFKFRYQTFGTAKAYEVEKIAYVLDHWDLLSEDIQTDVEAAASKGSTVGSQGKQGEARKEADGNVKIAKSHASMLENVAERSPEIWNLLSQTQNRRDFSPPPAKYVAPNSKAATLLKRDIKRGKIPNMQPSDADQVASLATDDKVDTAEAFLVVGKKRKAEAKAKKAEKVKAEEDKVEEPERRRSKRVKT